VPPGPGRPTERCADCAIDRIRVRGRKGNEVQATRYSSAPDPYAWLARELRQRGIRADADRLADQAAALRDRRRLDNQAEVETVRTLASAAKRARRAAEVAQSIWRMSPTSANRQALTEAYAARSEAMTELREELCNDEDMVSAAIRWVS
jgi:hypothetical protein